MPELGRAALVVCLGLALYALLVGGYAAATRKRRLARSAQNALFAALASTVVATIVLLAALLRHDFSFAYVAEHTSRRLPTPYTISAFWGGQEGSLLLWLLVLCGYSVAAVLTARRAGREVLAWVVPTLGLVGTFFALVLVFVASPFATQAAPADGAGLNPSLQNPYMMIHPPLGSSPRGAGRSSPGRRSESDSCWARTGRTSRWGGAATTPGIRSRTRR
ncbi:MAG: hypothetical protein E6G31_10425 [Actinobacteria bacterium]|nr:MAG: hypothetical protein E6G31_10425 [Actinomycetota bacterium]